MADADTQRGGTRSAALKKGREWLDEKHEVWRDNIDEWRQNERRLRGGRGVLTELTRFDYEKSTDPGVGYQARQDQATYVNFPDMFATTIGGHLMDNLSSISWGDLGDPKREPGQTEPSRAELIYYNVDGVGNDGSQLKAYIADAWKRAAATGHRWHFVEMPPEDAGNQAREIEGVRPYIIEFSPIRVTNWKFLRGTLRWAIVRVPMERKLTSDGVWSPQTLGYMLVTREGDRTFDADDKKYARGGQFFFDENGESQADRDVFWGPNLKGQIPMFVLYAERDKGTTELAAISRCLVSDLGNVAVSYMNLSSAADYDAWDAAKSIKFLAGVSKEGYNLAVEMLEDGSDMVPLEGSVNQNGQVSTVQVFDSATGAVAATVFQLRLTHKLEEARWLAAREAIGEPGSSGVSKVAGFGEAVKPRLVVMAMNLETWLNTLIYFFELRFDVEPKGEATWGLEFDLLEIEDKIERQFKLENLAGVKSPTLEAEALIQAGEDNGLIDDSEIGETIRQEYRDSAEAAIDRANAQTDLLIAAGGDITNPTRPGKKPPKNKPAPTPPAKNTDEVPPAEAA